MLQWTSVSYGIEFIPDLSDDDSERFVEDEEVTTSNYDIRTETNPPTASVIEAITSSLSPLLLKFVDFESTESSVDILTETPIIQIESIRDSSTNDESDAAQVDQPEIHVKKASSKSIKPRLLSDPKAEEIVMKSARRDGETLEEVPLEDTTTASDVDGENNETNIDIGEEVTTIQPPTSKKPKKIEIYKTRPNELLRHYVEDSHLRSPVAALIDKKTNPLTKAKKLWKAALKPNTLLDIMVVSYDSEGELPPEANRRQ